MLVETWTGCYVGTETHQTTILPSCRTSTRGTVGKETHQTTTLPSCRTFTRGTWYCRHRNTPDNNIAIMQDFYKRYYRHRDTPDNNIAIMKDYYKMVLLAQRHI